ncbi:O-methyltransferase family 3 protein [Sanghuangporus baumii]|uniref:O-methyltransferase family 3 protein n=1 Tax=Sanghuangporus baumii TaxID=108892 RepID=A0A9Q5HVF9_SANBA|nr:O-methyltransferase family 3 protein [Sanghuangporus baumii]
MQAPSNPLFTDEWRKADEYFSRYLLPTDRALESALENSKQNGLPLIAVSPVQGKFLMSLLKSIRAKRVLEVGLLGGYSTIWLARGLPDDGKVVTLEVNEKFAQVARQNIANADLLSKVEIKVGAAADTLKSLKSSEPFDFAFIDADEEGNPTYFAEAKRLVRKGGVIIVDNVNLRSRVSSLPADTDDSGVKAIRKLLEDIKDDGGKEVDATVLGLAGTKGFDGMLYAVKL